MSSAHVKWIADMTCDYDSGIHCHTAWHMAKAANVQCSQ